MIDSNWKLAKNVKIRVRTLLKLGGRVTDYKEDTASYFNSSTIEVELPTPSGIILQECSTSWYIPNGAANTVFSGKCNRPIFRTNCGIEIPTDWSRFKGNVKKNEEVIINFNLQNEGNRI